MQKILAVLYGFVAYLAAFTVLLYAIGFIEGHLVPKAIDDGVVVPLSEALVINLALMMVFALQHSVMARKEFKVWWTRFVPKPVERSTYVLFASVVLALLFGQWRPMTQVVWQVSDPNLATAITCLSFAGWLIVFSSTFLINHFELFGLHQVFSHLVGNDEQMPRFRTPLYYKVVRHPLYLGLLVAFWAAPVMSLGHFLFAAVTTAYIVVGALLEEHDLIEVFGDEYRRYRQRVSMIVPFLGKSS